MTYKVDYKFATTLEYVVVSILSTQIRNKNGDFNYLLSLGHDLINYIIIESNMTDVRTRISTPRNWIAS